MKRSSKVNVMIMRPEWYLEVIDSHSFIHCSWQIL